MSRLRFELAAMALMVILAGLTVVATFGSARSGDLVFCRMVDGGMVVGATTDCSDVIDDPPPPTGVQRTLGPPVSSGWSRSPG